MKLYINLLIFGVLMLISVNFVIAQSIPLDKIKLDKKINEFYFEGENNVIKGGECPHCTSIPIWAIDVRVFPYDYEIDSTNTFYTIDNCVN